MVNLSPSNCGMLGWFILLGYEAFLLLGLNEYLSQAREELTSSAKTKKEFLAFLVFAVLTLADYVPGYKVAALIEVFDRNLLGSFLLANVLTGLVNMSIDTLFVSPFTALATLVGYAYILSIAAAVAHVCGI
ncbi:uncharacterized protein At4g17910-like [Nicotiana tabacum]|uniref:Uncharacterized protein At4g17910-like n=1 Tax=Nicotiana tabacum TaxID=4097 RepID=A0AC58UG24_TOBAC